jgi:metal-dependent amidase/aminoacylase/carboxypeptidase family protein
MSNVGGYGVVGILEGGKPGPTYLWRADMDANADSSADNVEFKSVFPGVKHSCGHDVHTTIALGIAKVLSSMREKLSGTVLFLFQPAEENLTGAKAVIDAGLFERRKPDANFALHIGPLPAGLLTAKPLEMFAFRMRVRIELKDVTDQDETLKICAGFLKELNTPSGVNILAVPLDDREKGAFNPGSALTNYVAVAGTPRIRKEGDRITVVESLAFSSSDSIMGAAIARMRATVGSSPLKHQLVNISCAPWHPTVTNDPELTEMSMGILQKIYGNERIVPLYGVIPRFNDDFAFLQKETRGVYFFLGGSSAEQGIIAMPHAPNFTVDERCIGMGVKYFSSLLYELQLKPVKRMPIH